MRWQCYNPPPGPFPHGQFIILIISMNNKEVIIFFEVGNHVR